MSENNSSNGLLWTLVVIGILCLIVSVVAITKISSPEAVDYATIGSMIAAAVANIPAPVIPTQTAVAGPTAAEIAALVVIPDTGVTDNDKINDIYDSIYAINVTALKAEAKAYILDEVGNLSDEDTRLDILDEVGIDSDSIDEIDYCTIYDDMEITITNLGLDDADDRSATFNMVLKIRYNTEDNTQDVITKIVVSGTYFMNSRGHPDSTITYAIKAK